jgi:hypothetical protein
MVKTVKKSSQREGIVNLRIDTAGISRSDEMKIRKGLIIDGYYGRLPPGAGNLAWSIYKMLLREKTMKRNGLMEKNAGAMVSEYKNGRNLEYLVKKYDFPPSMIMRVLLSGYYGVKNYDIAKQILKGSIGLIKKYAINIDDLDYARDFDVIAGADQEIVQERAENYERHIEKVLTEQGATFITQSTLLEQARKKGIAPKATPDFLFTNKVFLNGTRVYWIDAKHSYGLDIPIVRKSLAKQMTKYIKLWGPGVVIFSAGFSDSLQIEDCIMGMIPAPSTGVV